MNMYYLEIKRFLKTNIKIIMFVFLILGILLSGIFTFLKTSNTEVNDKKEIEDSIAYFENSSRTAYFRFYLEKFEGGSFSNEATINEIFNTEEYYDEILDNLNIDIVSLIEKVEENMSNEDFSPIKVKIDNDSKIYAALFDTGNDSDNLKLAEYYYEELFTDKFDMLKNYHIHSIKKPKLIEVNLEKEKNNNQQKNNVLELLLKNTLIGFVFSIIITIGILLLKEMFSKTINYLFNYNTDNISSLIVSDQYMNNEQEVKYFIESPKENRKLILSETYLNERTKNTLIYDSIDLNFDIVNSLEQSSVSKKYDEIIIIIQTGITTKKWYLKQKNLLKINKSIVKLVQVN